MARYIGVRLSDAVVERIDVEAKLTGTTRSEVIRRRLTEALGVADDVRAWRPRPTTEVPPNVVP